MEFSRDLLLEVAEEIASQFGWALANYTKSKGNDRYRWAGLVQHFGLEHRRILKSIPKTG